MRCNLVDSTFAGGLFAIRIWLLRRPWPSAIIFSVLVAAIILVGVAVSDSVSHTDVEGEFLIRFVAFLEIAAYIALGVRMMAGWQAPVAPDAFGAGR